MAATDPSDRNDHGDILARSALFRALSVRERESLVGRARLRYFAANQTIFTKGSPGTSMMAVVSGRVRISVVSPEGREITLAVLPAGEVFGEIALFDGKERSADATVASDGACLAILERREVLSFFDQYPLAWRGLVEVLCARLRSTDDHIAEVALLPVPARLAKAVIRLSEPRPDGVRGPTARDIKISQRELGNMVGATRETVNKCLRQWQRRRLVRVNESGLTVTDRDALEEIAESG